MNFAERFKKKKLEELKKNPSEIMVAETSPNSFSIINQSLNCDLVRLKAFASGAERNAEKEKLIEVYRAHVEQYVFKKENYLNSIFVNFIVWLIDLDMWSEAIEYYPIAISQNQKMPEKFARDLKTFVADSLVVFAEKQRKNKLNFNFLNEIEEMLGWKIHDQIKGKICRILAETAFDADDLELSKSFAEKGLKFDEKCGLKVFLAKVEKELKKGK